MPNMTKQILAASLVRLLNRMPLDKITILDLVNDAQVSRKTFYYHFQDIYGLLEWVLEEEGRRVLQGHGADDNWEKRLWNTFCYFEKNRVMVLNVFRSLQKDQDVLERHAARLLLPLLEQHFDVQPGSGRVAPDDRSFLLDLYAYGLVKLFLHWIGSGMKPDAEQMMTRIHRLFRGSMEGFIERYLAE